MGPLISVHCWAFTRLSRRGYLSHASEYNFLIVIPFPRFSSQYMAGNFGSLIFLAVLFVVFFFLLLGFTGYHIYTAVLRNSTTNESFKYRCMRQVLCSPFPVEKEDGMAGVSEEQGKLSSTGCDRQPPACKGPSTNSSEEGRQFKGRVDCTREPRPRGMSRARARGASNNGAGSICLDISLSSRCHRGSCICFGLTSARVEFLCNFS